MLVILIGCSGELDYSSERIEECPDCATKEDGAQSPDPETPSKEDLVASGDDEEMGVYGIEYNSVIAGNVVSRDVSSEPDESLRQDQSVCGNGRVEEGEQCDPCPSSCDDGNVCTDDRLSGEPGTCAASCSNEPIEMCGDGDGCCPSGCDASNDDDCSASCGDGVLDSNETCDLPSSCPTTCDDSDACTTDVMTGSADNCNVECSYTDVNTCVDGDGCCPSACNANTDSDCSPTCGNGIVESGEECDGDCPTTCNDGDTCTSDVMTGDPSTCDAVCASSTISTCAAGDGCCPSGCDEATDADCAATCGNDVIESGETCDGDCPSTCDDGLACTTDTLSGDASTCDAVCTNDDITACVDGDGCCPSGCDATQDDDCAPICGNGAVETGETCDGDCPTSCDDGNACTSDSMSGSTSSCDAACSNTTISSCIDGDGCCPSGCDYSLDDDCAGAVLDCRDPSTWPSSWKTLEEDVVTLINQERAQGADCGTKGTFAPAGPVVMESALREASRCHSLDMATNNFFSHTGSDGSKFWDRASAAGYTDNIYAGGENIGAGYATAVQIVQEWMASDGHCANIMKSGIDQIGAGYAYDSNATYGDYWTTVGGAYQ